MHRPIVTLARTWAGTVRQALRLPAEALPGGLHCEGLATARRLAPMRGALFLAMLAAGPVVAVACGSPNGSSGNGGTDLDAGYVTPVGTGTSYDAAPAPAPVCTGTPTNVCQSQNETTCPGVPGCTWGQCEGIPCESFSESNCGPPYCTWASAGAPGQGECAALDLTDCQGADASTCAAAGCSWSGLECFGSFAPCETLSASTCTSELGCSLVDGGPPAPPSGFVGTWTLGGGGGSVSCQSPPQFPNEVLDPMTFTVTQLGPTTLGLSAVANNPAYQSADDIGLTLTIDGLTASGSTQQCWGYEPCQPFTLSIDSSYGSVYEAYGDGGSAGVESAPMALGLSASQFSDTSGYGDCTTVWNYVLLRQSCVNGPCGVCAPNAKECSGNAVQTCTAAAQWGTPVPCSGQTCENGACVGTCAAGATQCAGNAVEACDGGAWSAPSDCSNQACVNGACTGDCTPGAVGCSGEAPETCSADGAWLVSTACAQPTPNCDAGACSCATATLCGGVCVDEQTDDHNCGACGVSCAGTCALGRCVTTLSAEPQTMPYAIAVDATNVYWGTWETLPSPGVAEIPGTVQSVPIGGGTASVLASGFGEIWALALGSSTIYTAGSEGITALPKAPDAGADRTLEVGGEPISVATNGTSLFFADAAGDVVAFSIAQGTTTLVAAGANPWNLAADAQHVYWTNTGGTVSMAPVGGTDGGAPTVLASGETNPRPIAVDSANLYWGTSTALVRLPLGGDGGAPIVIAPALPIQIAVDATSVYWTYGNGTGGQVLKAPIGGGPVVVLAAGQTNPVGIAVDGTSVYWVNEGNETGAAVMKVTPK